MVVGADSSLLASVSRFASAAHGPAPISPRTECFASIRTWEQRKCIVRERWPGGHDHLVASNQQGTLVRSFRYVPFADGRTSSVVTDALCARRALTSRDRAIR